MTTDFFIFLADNWYRFLAAILIAYLLGSINFSIVINNLIMKREDIRSKGSGNAGFTNVLRSVGKGPAIATIVLDFLKGVLAVTIGGLLFTQFTGFEQIAPEYVSYGKYIAGFFCIVGHVYPCFFGFKGGKGVVTTAALAVCVDWRIFVLAISVFIIVFLVSKMVSLASVCAEASLPVVTFLVTYFMDYLPGKENGEFTIAYVVLSTLFTFGVALLIIIKHKSNIVRILNGTEKKITSKK